MWNDQFLIARRLVEAGARCVTVAYGFWDTHGGNFDLAPPVPAPVRPGDLGPRRGHPRPRPGAATSAWSSGASSAASPKINKTAGRDHWARVNSAMLSGGGMKVGQVIGSTDKLGGSAASRPVHYQDVLATVYHNLGIDPHAFIQDKADRPVTILPPTAEPIRELI